MAKLVINDLKEDKALDESAMKAVAGGSGGYSLSGRRRMSLSAMGTPGLLKESRLIRGLLKTPDAD